MIDAQKELRLGIPEETLKPSTPLLDLTGAALLRPSPEAGPAAGGSSLDPARFELDSDPEGLDICLANVAD